MSTLIDPESVGLGDSLHHRLSAQRGADGINIWPSAVLTFNHPLCVQIVCLGFLWILRNIHKMIFQNLNILKKMTEWSEGYTFSLHN